MQPVLNAPMGADDFIATLWRYRRTEQVIGRLSGSFCRGLARALHLPDGGQTGPLMIVLQPFDVGADCGRAGLDAAMISLDVRRGRGGLAGRVVGANDIIMQRALIALQGQDVVTALIDDLLGDLALTVERVD